MDPLEAALSSSFTAPNIPPASSKSAPPTSHEAPQEAKGHLPTRSVELEAERMAAMDDSWKEAYDSRLSEWKAENAARREQSERTRGEWEKRTGESTYSFTNATAGSSMASSFVDARDLVGGEGEGGKGVEALDQVLSSSAHKKPANHPSSGEDNSQGWENVPSESLASSYPSINFPPLDGSQPNPSNTAGASRPREALEGRSSSSPYYRRGQDGKKGPSAAALTLPPVAPPSVTLAIFDTTLSRRARLLALASSLAINLVLPFINGIMLGFGEIAAKSLFGWTGWGEVAGGLGLRGAGSRKPGKNFPRDLGTQKETPTILTMP